jgi:hypothetical protein|tara:strand:- start:5043 stop:5300 length:258 start_codon:yes stop_codon:yes gene_type:complete
MKTKKLLKKVARYLDLSAHNQAETRAEMKVIFKKLKKKERDIRDKIVTEENDLKRKRFQREVDIIHAQRSKGLQVYKAARDAQPE